MSATIHRDIAKSMLERAKGRFCAIEFIKKDGSIRTLTVQPHAVKTHLVENPTASGKQAAETRRKNHPNLFPVYDVHARQIKSVNLDTLCSIKVDGKKYAVSDTTAG